MKKVLTILGHSLCIVMLTACSSLEGPERELHIDRSQVIAEIKSVSRLVMIKKDDTLQLNFSAVAVNDAIVSVNPENLSWYSQDPLKVSVDSTGRIVGKSVSSTPTKIILTYRTEESVAADTVVVVVTSDSYDEATIKLVQLDSNIVGGSEISAFVGLANPRVRVDIVKGNAIIVKGLETPLSVRKPMKLDFVINGGPDSEPVYRIVNPLVFIGPFWVKVSVNLYGNIVADSLMFIGQYQPTANFVNYITQDEFGNVISRILDPLDLEPQLQPCGVFIVFNFTSKPVDIVFSDSAEAVFDCDSLPAPLFGLNSTGENLLSIPPFGRGNRRISSLGMVSYYARDAVTKERLPYSGRYESITAKK